MKQSIFFFFTLLLICAWGCNKAVEDQNTERIDSVLAVVEGAQKVMNTLDSNNVVQLRNVYNAYYDFFSNEYGDISNKDFYTSSLADMAECNKRLTRTVMSFQGWKGELNRVHNQLSTLRHDYSYGLIEQEYFETYFNNESIAAGTINDEISKNVGMVSICMRNHKELSTKLDSARTAWLAQKEE